MEAELKELLKKNLEATKESLKILRKIHKDILWRRIFGLVKFGLVAAIFVWSYLQFQPILNDLLATYQGLLGSQPGQGPGIDLNSLPPGAKNLIENLIKK